MKVLKQQTKTIVFNWRPSRVWRWTVQSFAVTLTSQWTLRILISYALNTIKLDTYPSLNCLMFISLNITYQFIYQSSEKE